MYIYFITIVIFILFCVYLFLQVKIKNNKNYPISYAITLGFIIFISNSNIDWIILNINKLTSLNLSVPTPISSVYLSIFLIFLIFLISIYYKYTFVKNKPKYKNQINKTKSIINYGKVEQKNVK